MSNAAAANVEPATIHVFERAGLGLAPFRFIGAVEQDMAYGMRILNRGEYNKTGIMECTQPGGTCDFCGHAILHMFRVLSSDGREFKVGSDCILKTGDVGLVKRVKAAVKAREATRRAAKAAAVTAALPAAIFANRRALRAAPHPYAHFREYAGRNLLSYAAWVARHGGDTSKARVLATIAKLVAQ